MYSLFHDFQTFIVGVLGFVGVISTLLTNAYLQRRQHDRQVTHEARTLRIALKTEPELIATAFRERIKSIDNAGESSAILIPLDTMTDTYAKLIDRIGLLSAEEVRTTMTAYVLIRQMPQRIELLARSQATREERETGFAHIEAHISRQLDKCTSTTSRILTAQLTR